MDLNRFKNILINGFYLYYPVIFYLSYRVFYHAGQAAQHYQAAIERLDLSSQTELAWKSLLEKLSLNLYEGASEITEEVQLLQQQAQFNLQQLNLYSILFAIITIAYIAYLFFSHRKEKQSKKNNINLHLVAIAVICLIIGVSLPMLNIIAFKELPVLGTVIFKYESKSILSTIEILWQKTELFYCTSYPVI